jgi:hypothetical protein
MLPDHELCSSESEYSEEELSRLVTLTPQIELSSGSNFVPVKIKELQQKDLDVGPILCWLKKDSNRPEWSVVAPYGKVTKILWAQWDSLCIRDGCVYRLWEGITPSSFHYQLVVPNELRSEVLKELHGTQATGHFGVNKTIQRVKQRFYWPQCQTDVKEFIKQCDGCSSRKGPPRKPKAPLQLYTVGAPMERIAIDIMGPLPVSENGNRYLLVTMDYFSKWPEVYPIPNQEARTVANALVREFFCRFAIPKELHSDQGRNFESNLLKEVCAILGIRKTRTTPYHPQSDGMVERFNRTLAAQLSLFINENQTDWDEHLSSVLLAYRTAVHKSTGQTPAKLMMGHELRLPVDLIFGRPPDENTECETDYGKALSDSLERAHQFARSQIFKSGHKMKIRYDVDASSSQFEKGNEVWLYTPQKKRGLSPKLQRYWKGPYSVVKRINDLVYKIQLGPRSKPIIVHRNRLWKYSGNKRRTWLEYSREKPESSERERMPRTSGRDRRPPEG